MKPHHGPRIFRGLLLAALFAALIALAGLALKGN